MPAAKPHLERIAALDGLRAFAVLAVILFHISPDLVPGGFVGVDLFFVLSGYIITRGLVAEADRDGTISIAAFYRRRAWRLLPALAALLVAVASISVIAPGAPPQTHPLDVLAASVSLMNWRIVSGASDGGNLAHAWSLSVEEQFYLLWPLLLLFLHRSRRGLALLLAAAAIASILSGFAHAHSFHRTYFGSDVRVQGLALGCLLALSGTTTAPAALTRLWPVPVLLLALIVLSVRPDTPTMPEGGFALAALASAWLIWVALGDARSSYRAVLTSGPAQWLGRRSYSAYLWHYPIVHLAMLLPLQLRYAAPLSILLSMAAADLSFRFLEDRRRVGAACDRLLLLLWPGRAAFGYALAAKGGAETVADRRPDE